MMVLLCYGIIVSAQNRSISGTVVSAEDGSPIAGAFVMVTGSDNGTSTDADGHFFLGSVPTNAATLTASMLGMHDAVAPIAQNMTIKMQAENEVLEEVMVVAYGTVKKSSYSGSASMVRADKIANLPVTSFENALSGRVAGLQITNSSGQAGSASSIRIRGNGSMNASNEPLYVIDGVPVTSGNVGQMGDYIMTSNNIMNSLNPSDIESVSVLKDAAASSLYGSRAANGVIVITTKKGSSGTPTVHFGASIGITPSWATGNYETASVQENANMLYSVFYSYAHELQGKDEAASAQAAATRMNGKFNKHGYTFTPNGTGMYDGVTITEYDNSGRQGRYFDWEDAYFRTAVYQNYDLSVSGATNNGNYYTSISYTNDQGRLKVNGFDRFSGRVNLNQKVGNHFEIGTNISLSRSSKSGYNDSRSTGSNLFMQTRNLLWGFYYPTDYKDGSDWTARYGSYAQNGVYYDNEWENSSINTKVSAVETLTAHICEGLNLKSILSYDNTAVRDHIYFSANHFNGSSSNGKVNEMRTTYEKIVSSTTADFNRYFGDHNLGLLAGFEIEDNKTDFARASGDNLPTSTLHTVSTAGTLSAAGYDWGNSMVSLISKVDYNYKEKYYASASYRRDGSSKLSPETRWGDFWSVAGSWRIKREAFMSDIDWIDELRLRASYGVNGTLPSGNYGYMNLMSYNSKYVGNPGGVITTLANNALTWETSYSTNIGVDFGVLNNRISGSVEYFNRDSKNLLQDVPVSMVTGFNSTLQNIGMINNQGIEIELSGDIYRTKDFTWSANFNAAFLSSKIKRLYDGQEIIWYDPTGDDDRAQYIYREGESSLAFYGYEWAGVDHTNGKSVYYTNDGTDGDFLFNGKGATYDYKKAEYTIIGNAIPIVSGGIGTDLRWKDFDLSLNFAYKIGGNIYDGAEKDVADDGYYWERIRSKNYYKNMWTPEHTSGTQPAISGLDLEDAMQYSSRHIYNASYLRLKSLSLGYSIPKPVLKKVRMSSARVFFTGTNLLTFSAYKNADPEVNSYGTRGWETPFGRTYTMGIDINF